ncbi:DUF2125 domain-containing protein [Parvularcula oceani]|uniref:DUF2125 domain-containing protein n=1 Tax=Parvularcula oceani TaxID=1247963 RepID=UPI0004E17595|nr:DUF2125 domain-containing protein [Parvularcula oceani]
MTTTEQVRRPRRRFLAVFAVALTLLGAYTALWVWGAGVMRDEIDAWIAAERRAGRTVSHGDIRVRGFPGTLRAVIDAPSWAEPGAWSWQAERLLVITLPYDPRRLILAPRGEQSVTYLEERFALRADDLRVGLEEDLLAIETSGLSAEGRTGTLALASGRANWVRNEDGSAVLGLATEKMELRSETGTVYLPYVNAALSEAAGRRDLLTVDAFSLAAAPGREVKPALVAGDGSLILQTNGYPEGRVNLRLRNPVPLMMVLGNLGVVPAGQAQDTGRLLAGLAGGENDELALPLIAKDGALRIGPVPVGRLPRLAY